MKGLKDKIEEAFSDLAIELKEVEGGYLVVHHNAANSGRSLAIPITFTPTDERLYANMNGAIDFTVRQARKEFDYALEQGPPQS